MQHRCRNFLQDGVNRALHSAGGHRKSCLHFIDHCHNPLFLLHVGNGLCRYTCVHTGDLTRKQLKEGYGERVRVEVSKRLIKVSLETCVSLESEEADKVRTARALQIVQGHHLGIARASAPGFVAQTTVKEVVTAICRQSTVYRVDAEKEGTSEHLPKSY